MDGVLQLLCKDIRGTSVYKLLHPSCQKAGPMKLSLDHTNSRLHNQMALIVLSNLGICLVNLADHLAHHLSSTPSRPRPSSYIPRYLRMHS